MAEDRAVRLTGWHVGDNKWIAAMRVRKTDGRLFNNKRQLLMHRYENMVIGKVERVLRGWKVDGGLARALMRDAL